MRFSILLDTNYLCGNLSGNQVDMVLDVLRHAENFDFQYEIFDEAAQSIYEVLHEHRHDFAYQEFSRWLDRKSALIKYLDSDNFFKICNEP